MSTPTLLLFLLLLVTPIISLTITQHPQPLPHEPYRLVSSEGSQPLLTKCTKDQFDTVNTAIAACEYDKVEMADVAQCITHYLSYNTYYHQVWNVFIKSAITNPDTVSFWYYDGCQVAFEKTGKHNWTYVMWPSEGYWPSTTHLNQPPPSLTSLTSFTSHKSPSSSSSSPFTSPSITTPLLPTLTTCPQWKTTTLTIILRLCDIPSNSQAASCIKNQLYDKLYENWNVYVSTTTDSYVKAIVMGNGCYVRTNPYSSFNRTVAVWAGE